MRKQWVIAPLGNRPPHEIAEAQVDSDLRFHIAHRLVEQLDELGRRIFQRMHRIRWLIKLNERYTRLDQSPQVNVNDLRQPMRYRAGNRHLDRLLRPGADVIPFCQQS